MRLIRSKGVGVFFVTQSPTDVPDEVLAQLGSRVQHALRAHTPNDAKALKATVNTYPNAAYDDLGEVITTLGIGEAIITVMGERGAPTPVAWTRLRAPESLMAPTAAETMQATVAASPRHAKYAAVVDRESAREMLAKKLEEGAAKAAAEKAAADQAKADAKEAKDAKRREVLDVVAAAYQGGGGRRHAGREVRRLPAVHAHRGRRDRPRAVRHRPPLTSPLTGRPSGTRQREVIQADQRSESAIWSASGCTPCRSSRSLISSCSASAWRVLMLLRSVRSRSCSRSISTSRACCTASSEVGSAISSSMGSGRRPR